MTENQFDSPEKTTETRVHIRLCSLFNAEFSLVCDEPEGHTGAHRASVFWDGDEGTDE